MLTERELAYYSRQLLLKEVDTKALEKLKDCHILVVGAGGLGCPALLYLAGTGVGTITIADGDIVSESNLHRQVLYGINDIGKNKAEIACQKLKELNPYLAYNSYAQYITGENMLQLVSNADVVIDASDNFETRYLLGDYTAEYRIPLVFAAVFGFEGQLSVFNYGNGPAFQQVFPANKNEAYVPNCALNGVVGFVPGILGCMQAAEAFKIITGIGEVMSGKLMILDLLTMEKRELLIKHDKSMPSSNNYQQIVHEISVNELSARLKTQAGEVTLLDVREPYEFSEFNIGGIHIPLGMLPERLHEIKTDKDIVVICKSGVRSYKAAQYLSKEFKTNRVFNLKGGLMAWVSNFH